MPKLPVRKPREIVAILKKNGFVLVRSDGAHHRYHHPDGRKVTVAFHIGKLKKEPSNQFLDKLNGLLMIYLNNFYPKV